MSLGSFTVRGGPYLSGLTGVQFDFETMQFEGGIAWDQLVDEEEELIDVGVDKRRYRLINQQFRKFRVSTVENLTTYGIGLLSVQLYLKANRKTGDLVASLNGNNYKWKDVKVASCVPVLQRAQMAGVGIASSNAVIMAEWVFEMTKWAGVN